MLGTKTAVTISDMASKPAEEVIVSKKTWALFSFFILLLLFTAGCHRSTSAEESDSVSDRGEDTDSGSESEPDNDSGTQTDSDSDQIAIDPKDQWCEDNQECAVVFTSCNPYSFAAVNELASEEYYQKYREVCQDVQWEQPLFTATAECMTDWQSDRKKCALDRIAIESDAARVCELAGDCVSVSSRCDACECFGLPINSAHKEEASMLFKDVCRDYQGGMCDILCEETRNLECLEGYCTWVE